MSRGWPAAGSIAVIAVLLVGVFALWMAPRLPRVVAVGAPIRHDDFVFTVTQVRRHKLAGGTALYRVFVNVRNEAKVVNYRWRDSIAYVRAFDARGFGHDFFPVTKSSFVLPAGEERTADLEFLIPPAVSSPGLHFWDGIFMGDAFNGADYARAVVPLGDYHPPIGT